MTPGKLPDDKKLTIYRGGADAYTLTLTDSEGAIDLTSYTFRAQIRDKEEGTLLLELTVAITDAAAGVMEISWLAADTTDLAPGFARWGLIDQDDVLWIEDDCIIAKKTPAND